MSVSPFASQNTIGHQRVCQTLDHYVRTQRIPQGLLFQGVQGIGKATLALEFAAHLVVSGDSNSLVESDGTQREIVKRQIIQGSHPNVRYLKFDPLEDGAHIPLARVREILHFFHRTAAKSEDYRILIIDAVDDLSVAGANALLKTIEEPPARACILVINHSVQKLLPTLRSRLIKIDFSVLSNDEMTRVATRYDEPISPAILKLAAGQPGIVNDVLGTQMSQFVSEATQLIQGRAPKSPVVSFVSKWFTPATRGQWSLQLGFLERILLQEISADGRDAGTGENTRTRRHITQLMQTYDSLVKNVDQYRILNLDLQSVLCQSLSNL